MSNPLLDFSGLPLFDRIRPEHVAPAIDVLLAERQARWNGHTTRLPADWTPCHRAGRGHRAAGPRLGCGQPPQQRGRHARAARRLQRQPARITEFWTRLGADERLYAKYKAIDAVQRHAEPGAAPGAGTRTRCATSCCRAPSCTGAAKERFAAIQERQAELSQKFSENALDATDAFSYYATEESWPACPRTCCRPPAPRRAGRRQGRLQAHAEDALLPAGDAVCHSSALRERCTAPTSPAPATRPKACRKFDNTAADARDPGLRQEEARCWATQLRRGVAGAQDGRIARSR
jgi:oligopeptidase A